MIVAVGQLAMSFSIQTAAAVASSKDVIPLAGKT
jgi:hypothetical protein